MSQRGYFDLRYTIPGFTFILIIVGINSIPIIDILQSTGTPDVYGAFFAFFSLLTGSAVGFLVSQIYWWNFNRNEGILGIEKYEETEAVLKKFGYVPPKNDKNKVTAAILDFVMYLEEDELLGYIWRRWDMYHLLSATYYVLGIGLLTGIISRIFIEHLWYDKSILNLAVWSTYNPLTNAGSFLFLCIISGIIVLLLVFNQARKSLLKNFLPAFKGWVRDGFCKDIKRVKKAFSEYFPEQSPNLPYEC